MILKISARFRGKVEISSKKLFNLWLKLGFHRRFRCKDILTYVRSSHPEVFCKKGVLWSFTKRLCQSLFFNKVAGLRLATLFKKRLWQRYFPVNFVKEHLRSLLLICIDLPYCFKFIFSLFQNDFWYLLINAS